MKKMLQLVCCTVLAATMAFGLTGCSSSAENSNPPSEENTSNENGDSEAPEGEKLKIGVIQHSEHAALDAARDGFLEALKEKGYDESKVEFDIQNAQNDQSNLKTISQRLVQNKNDLILAVATPAAQSVANETTEIPILVTAVTDLVEAGLVTSNEAPGSNVSGTSDLTPVKEQLDLMMEIMPEVKTIGIMYNSSETNSEIQAKMAEKCAQDLGLSVEFGTVTSTNDIAQALQSIAGKVDVLYIPTDNTFASAMATVGSLAEESKIPTIVGEQGMCEAGGLATVGIDYYKLGYQTGEMAALVLEGADIATMPVETASDASICINLDTARAIGIEVPQAVLDRAETIIETK